MRGPISNAIIKLNENGYISRLKNQWWKKERGGGTCIVCIIFNLINGKTSILVDRKCSPGIPFLIWSKMENVLFTKATKIPKLRFIPKSRFYCILISGFGI